MILSKSGENPCLI